MKVKFILVFLLAFNMQQLFAEVNKGQQRPQGSIEPEKFRVGVMAGESQTDVAAIDSSLTGQIYFDADITHWLGARIGYRNIENFTTKTLSPVELKYEESIFVGLNLSYINTTTFVPYAGIEYINWKLKSTAFGEELGRKDGTGAAVHAGVRFNISSFVGLNMEYGQMNRIDDADIEYLQLGVYLRFH